MTRRDSYADVGKAMRESIERALADDTLTGRDWKVLGAILHELASYSRLSDRIHAARFSELTGVDERGVRRSVVKLVDAGAIRREPSLGRYPSTYALPWFPATSIDAADPGRGRPASEPPTLVLDDPPTLVVDDHPSEEVLREETGGDGRAGADGQAHASEAEPDEYEALDALLAKLPGASPTPKQLAELRLAYAAAPDGVAAVVAESKSGHTPIALLMSKVARGEHVARQAKANHAERQPATTAVSRLARATPTAACWRRRHELPRRARAQRTRRTARVRRRRRSRRAACTRSPRSTARVAHHGRRRGPRLVLRERRALSPAPRLARR